MTFSDREKFIYHLATMMTMRRYSKKLNVEKFVNSFLAKKSTNLTNEEVKQIYLDIEKEMLSVLEAGHKVAKSIPDDVKEKWK